VTGKPKASGSFQSFQVQYDLRVDREADTAPVTANNSLNKNTFVIVGLLAIATGVGIYLKSKK
jgi:hypothetical protein